VTWEVRQGDALALLREMPDESVRCCVTSPPYWGLRDYGTAKWEGGADGCDHKGMPLASSSSSSLAGYTSEDVKMRTFTMPQGQTCRKCGAARIDAQLGLEATPEEYVARMVEVFSEVRRVLTKDGTLWLNLGDSYATGAGKVGACPGGGEQGARWAERAAATSPNRMPIPGLKPKDLVGIPWRVAFALHADGWYLRSDIIWAKPNPMPESVTDRPTKAHEYLFLLAKSERYFYDADAIEEPALRPEGPGNVNPTAFTVADPVKGRTAANLHHIGPSPTRNRRTVWTVASQPFAEAHFATFPEAPVEPCILAGSAPGDLVLDPFSGSGTVGVVALRHGRRYLGLELNPAYCEMARRRIAGPLFADGAQ
jgi:DNA modification methylase